MLNAVSVNSEKDQTLSTATELTSHNAHSSGWRSVVVPGIRFLVIGDDLVECLQLSIRGGPRNAVNKAAESGARYLVGKSSRH